jgi:hypothetical protein
VYVGRLLEPFERWIVWGLELFWWLVGLVRFIGLVGGHR